GWTGDLHESRSDHSAPLLAHGRVLGAGRSRKGLTLANAEMCDPGAGAWTTTGSLSTDRDSHTATLLPDGKVLVAAGYKNGTDLSSAELYDPVSGLWTPTASLHTRSAHTATLLPN